MQQIERYGIIALLFLVVSIVVVALWDPDPRSPAEGTDTSTVAAAQPQTAPQEQEARPTQAAPRRNQARSQPTTSGGPSA